MALKICMHAFIFVSKAAKSWSMNIKFPCLSKRKKISIAFCLEHALSLSIKLYWKHVWNIRVPPYNEANLGWQKHETVIGLFSSQSVPSITLFLNLILNNADVFVLGSCTMVFIITTRIFRPKGLNLFICNARKSLRFAVKFSCYHISLTLSTSLSWLSG